jgi:hypothetical protein
MKKNSKQIEKRFQITSHESLGKSVCVFAPIALFVYSRHWHTKQTVEALKNNKHASESDLFIFSDAPKTSEIAPAVLEVREYIKTISGFKTVCIVEREENLGLANSIIDGVTQLCEEFGQVIVLEDDLVTSPCFLEFMNRALYKYAEEKKVWHISAWNYPIDSAGLPELFFWRTMNCWGWATWADRWVNFQKNPERLMTEWDKNEINQFNLDGACDYWSQVTANASGKLNTWAIFWYATIFENKGLCLNPVRTYVKNIGHDGSGENCSKSDIYNAPITTLSFRSFPDSISTHIPTVETIRKAYFSNRLNIFRRTLNKLKRIYITRHNKILRDKVHRD